MVVQLLTETHQLVVLEHQDKGMMVEIMAEPHQQTIPEVAEAVAPVQLVEMVKVIQELLLIKREMVVTV